MGRSTRKPTRLFVLGLILASTLGLSGHGDVPSTRPLGLAQSSAEFSIKNPISERPGHHFTLNPVQLGDSVQAGSSNVRIRLTQGSEIRLARHSEVRFPDPYSVELNSGEVLVASRPDLEFDLTTSGLYVKPGGVHDPGGPMSSLQVLRQSEDRIRMRSLVGDWTVYSKENDGIVTRLVANNPVEISKSGGTWTTSGLGTSALPGSNLAVFEVSSPVPTSQLGAIAGSGATAAAAGSGVGSAGLVSLGTLAVAGGIAVENELDEEGHNEDQDSTSPVGP